MKPCKSLSAARECERLQTGSSFRYGIRKKLGLRNSSNTGEKMNDLVVSYRQKHDGISWSESGSVSLASIEVLKRNRKWAKWFEEGDLEFNLAA